MSNAQKITQCARDCDCRLQSEGETSAVAVGSQPIGYEGSQTEKVLVLCSGGLDSTTLLAQAVATHGAENVVALSISYGQKHVRELKSAQEVCAYYGVERYELDLGAIFAKSSCSLLVQSEEEIPHESYAQQQRESSEPVSTYVPFRNGLFLASAASMALSLDCSALIYGAHADDWAGAAYPDCSPAFVAAMNEAIKEGTANELRIEAPFVSMNKADIVRLGISLEVPYELTWSCYEGKETPCGECATCLDRQAAFEANGIVDPLLSR